MDDLDCGLRAEDWAVIRGVLARYPGIKSAVLFGSRAKGTHRNGSDIDLALFGSGSSDLDHDLILEISAVLNEETLLPYHFDLLDYDRLESPVLREHIDRVGIPIHPIPKPR
jgi:uncharacterized protein